MDLDLSVGLWDLIRHLFSHELAALRFLFSTAKEKGTWGLAQSRRPKVPSAPRALGLQIRGIRCLSRPEVWRAGWRDPRSHLRTVANYNNQLPRTTLGPYICTLHTHETQLVLDRPEGKAHLGTHPPGVSFLCGLLHSLGEEAAVQGLQCWS